MTETSIDSLFESLRNALGDSWVSRRLTDRIAYSRDQWPRSLLRIRQKQQEPLPDIVAWPQNPEEVATTVRLCKEAGFPLVATGAGSSVTGAVVPVRRGVAMDLKRLQHVRSIDLKQGIAEVEAGVIGIHLEEELQRAGATLGHFPSSILCSSFGGWVATRSAGQASSRYGKIEDMVIDIEFVSADGKLQWIGSHPSLLSWLVGSEGMFGLITAARVRIHPVPAHRTFRGFLFPNVKKGLEAMRHMLQQNQPAPAILRLYDALDTMISSHKNADSTPEPPPTQQIAVRPKRPSLFAKWQEKWTDQWLEFRNQWLQNTLQNANIVNQWLGKWVPQNALLIVGCEGYDPKDAETQMARLQQICHECDGEDLGASPGWHWFHHRYSVSFKQSQVFETGAFSDTFEVASSWSQLPTLYREVKEALQSEAFVMAHFSHAYPEGCSIYFSFVSYAESEEELLRYDRIWRAGMTAAARVGGTVSHHHGVGLGKSSAMPLELGEAGMKLLRGIHQALSPADLLNPGKFELTETKG